MRDATSTMSAASTTATPPSTQLHAHHHQQQQQQHQQHRRHPWRKTAVGAFFESPLGGPGGDDALDDLVIEQVRGSHRPRRRRVEAGTPVRARALKTPVAADADVLCRETLALFDVNDAIFAAATPSPHVAISAKVLLPLVSPLVAAPPLSISSAAATLVRLAAHVKRCPSAKLAALIGYAEQYRTRLASSTGGGGGSSSRGHVSPPPRPKKRRLEPASAKTLRSQQYEATHAGSLAPSVAPLPPPPPPALTIASRETLRSWTTSNASPETPQNYIPKKLF